MLRRILLRVSYDGTEFCGWQFQPSKRSVEGELNKALSELTGEEITVIGASRTDSGVHSMGSVAVFDTQSNIPADKFMYAVNTKIPDDMSVIESKEVSQDFHPRRVNSKKTYRYRIVETGINDPLRSRYAYFCPVKLDETKMNEAAKYLVGTHNFKSFCSVHTQAETTVRELYDAKVYRNNDEVIIEVTGAGFLYNMVRIIAGSLLEVGRGKYEPSHIEEILKQTDRCVAGPTLEAKGLTMVKTEFECESDKTVIGEEN